MYADSAGEWILSQRTSKDIRGKQNITEEKLGQKEALMPHQKDASLDPLGERERKLWQLLTTVQRNRIDDLLKRIKELEDKMEQYIEVTTLMAKHVEAVHVAREIHELIEKGRYGDDRA